MLKSIYKIEESIRTGNSITVCILLNPEHDIFKAHFPENPIMPGVMLIQIGRDLLSDILNLHLRLQSAKNIKFLSIINPVINPRVYFHIDFTEVNGLIQADIMIKFEETVFTKIRATFKETVNAD